MVVMSFGRIAPLFIISAHLKAVEVREEDALAVDVRANAQGQLLVDIVPDVHQGRHIQGQPLHPWVQDKERG